MHCYFLASASPATPIVYSVEILRQGKSYVTCSVKAVQKGAIIFVLLSSFQKPEPWQHSRQWVMPSVPPPDECLLEEDIMMKAAKEDDSLDPRVRNFLTTFAGERMRSPIAVKRAREHEIYANGEVRYMYWMQARSIPKYEAHFQKCILAYLSDLYLIGVIGRVSGLKRFSKGPEALSMTSSIDHAIYFYDDNFDCGDWLLYVMESPRASSGRGISRGQLFTRQGTLVAVTTQEGVVRANVRSPDQVPSPKL